MLSLLLAMARLIRAQMALLTVSVPILGALTVGQPLSVAGWLGLSVIGLCAHIFGFTLNDLADRTLDATVAMRCTRPLVAGEITRRTTWALALLQIPLAFGIYRFFLRGPNWGLGMLGLGIALSAIYNTWSKWGRLPRIIPELALAVSVGLLCLCGALAQSLTLPPESLVFALALALALLLLNSVPNHLKDIKTDSEFGVQSFVLSTGTKMAGQDTILVSRVLWVYSLSLQAATGCALLAGAYLFRPTWPAAAASGLLAVYAGLHLRMVLKISSWQQLRRSAPLLGGFYHYFALSMLLVDRMPAGIGAWYWCCALALLGFPWWLVWRMWSNRYELEGVM